MSVSGRRVLGNPPFRAMTQAGLIIQGPPPPRLSVRFCMPLPWSSTSNGAGDAGQTGQNGRRFRGAGRCNAAVSWPGAHAPHRVCTAGPASDAGPVAIHHRHVPSAPALPQHPALGKHCRFRAGGKKGDRPPSTMYNVNKPAECISRAARRGRHKGGVAPLPRPAVIGRLPRSWQITFVSISEARVGSPDHGAVPGQRATEITAAGMGALSPSQVRVLAYPRLGQDSDLLTRFRFAHLTILSHLLPSKTHEVSDVWRGSGLVDSVSLGHTPLMYSPS